MSSLRHVIEYAKSGRAKCHGDCIDRCIPRDCLRYGSVYNHPQYGDATAWFHWECSSKALPKLSKVRLEQVPGFRQLRPEDQERVRVDVQARRISAVPSSSQTISEPPSSSQPASSQPHATHEAGVSRGQKRKRTQEVGSQQNRDNNAAATNEDDEYFDPSQDEAKDELYISLSSKIVGVQYYGGLVGAGEEVTLVRELDSQYDKNAIQVLNISGEKVGHIPRNVAEKLAPLIDSNRVAVEGVIQGRSTQYLIPLTLRIYGASHRRPELERLLVWATPKQRGFTDAMRPNGYPGLPSSSQIASTQASAGSSGSSEAQRQRIIELQRAAELKSLLNSLEKVDDEGRRASLLDIVCPTEDLLNLPTHPDPPSVANGQLKVDLLRHQNQALQWCIERENPVLPQKENDRPVQFWQYKVGPDKKPFYLNLVTHTPQTNPPELGRGGLMADAMGLGKTLTMLALITATKADVSENFSNSTLIVVPVSVISNWKTQINDHFTEGSLTYHVYHEAGRTILPEKLAKYDVVVTAYPTVTGDFAFASKGNEEGVSTSKKKKVDQGLFGIKWKRIILDEGHTIRNSKTKMSVAVKNLEAERRWVVSGTPIINSPKDLGSLLGFLRICRPLDNDEYYKRLIMRPITQGAPEGAELLKALMSHICIRRTKEMQNEKGEYLVPLPPVEMTLVPVKLDEATKKLYDEIEALSQQRFTSMMDNQSRSGSFSMPTNVLSLLTRLRQLTLHPGLIPRNYLDQLRSMVALNADAHAPPPPAIPITPEERIRLQNVLARAIEDSEECPVCFEISNEPRITPCAHIFCLACIAEVISRDPRCPMDRRTINMSDLIPPLPPTDATQAPPAKEEDDDEDGPATSAKIEQLIHLLQLTPRNEKSLVFSQFTSFLDKIAEALDEAGIAYVRFDGQMSVARRQKVLERFNQPLEEIQNAESSQNAFSMTQSTRSTRNKRNTNGFIGEFDGAGDKDDDFVLDDDDDPYEDVSEDEWSKKSKGKGRGRGKGKEKGKGKGKQKANGKTKLKDDLDYTNEVNPAIMLISLKAGALGLNLTVANNVYLMDPWWQEGIESQAIDRCNRIGQTKPVHVYQLVAENTVEAKVLEIQERKKKLIREAFSGLKSTETPRLKKEARLQDLIELFGARRDADHQTST